MISKPTSFAVAISSLLFSSLSFAQLAPQQSDLRERTPPRIHTHHVAYCALGMYMKAISFVQKNGTDAEMKNLDGDVRLSVEAFEPTEANKDNRYPLALGDSSLTKIGMPEYGGPNEAYFSVSGTIGGVPVTGETHLIYDTAPNAQSNKLQSTCSPLVGTENQPGQIAMTLYTTTSPSVNLLDFAPGTHFDNANP